jgi:hypothetical protein
MMKNFCTGFANFYERNKEEMETRISLADIDDKILIAPFPKHEGYIEKYYSNLENRSKNRVKANHIADAYSLSLEGELSIPDDGLLSPTISKKYDSLEKKKSHCLVQNKSILTGRKK